MGFARHKQAGMRSGHIFWRARSAIAMRLSGVRAGLPAGLRALGLALACALACAPHARADDVIRVQLDYAKLLKLPPGTNTLVIGNPGVADVAVQRNQLMVVTGRSYGRTNLIALDDKGAVISESMIEVSAPGEGRVVLQRGMETDSFNCTPRCAPMLVPGDGDKAFGTLRGQFKAREEIARDQKK